jgi:ATP-dependent RNA helicase DHX57
MGKKKGESKGSKVPVCECQHPYNCECGKRPERPSRGHKWDPEAKVWGGKGHKQKGGVGGAVVATAATVTEKGKTAVAQWMKMPHQLLMELCKKEKRPPPKFKALDNQQGNKFKYRVIVQDAKASKRGGEHDLIFIPKVAVENEEQAKEEAALLALLSLNPTIPHERKLPEPYKTTWLNAISATKSKDSQSKPDTKDTLPDTAIKVGNGSNAKASSSLLNARSYSSISDKRKQEEEKRKEKMAKIRKHEAIRMANRDMQVFMSAKMRLHIETLLRGDADAELLSALVSEDDSLSEQDYGDEDIVKSYVIDRLTHEGFTMKQANAGYAAAMKNPSSSMVTLQMDNEDKYMDKCYEESLQWLCVHLDETHLPEGFNPRGRSLEVISTKTKAQTSSFIDPVKEDKIKKLSNKYGVSQCEAMCLLKDESLPEIDLFNSLLKFNKMRKDYFGPMDTLDEKEQEENIQKSLEEEEVLKAIFPLENDLQIEILSENVKQIQISLPVANGTGKKMVLEYPVRSYPSVYPKIFIIGGWGALKEGTGTAIHLLLYKFLMSLSLHEPMVFEVFNYAQELLHTINDEASIPILSGMESHLLPFLDGGQEFVKQICKTKPDQMKKVEEIRSNPSESFNNIVKVKQRPRAQNAFWRVPPNQTLPAKCDPDVPKSIRIARDSLPAAAAKDEFLLAMEQADKHNKVVLVTGETGCGKVSQFTSNESLLVI